MQYLRTTAHLPFGESGSTISFPTAIFTSISSSISSSISISIYVSPSCQEGKIASQLCKCTAAYTVSGASAFSKIMSPSTTLPGPSHLVPSAQLTSNTKSGASNYTSVMANAREDMTGRVSFGMGTCFRSD